MAEDHLKRSASFGTRRDEPSFEEDPLVELARIVAEDGGFYRQGRAPELRPARNEPAHGEAPSPEEALANQLEAELMQNLDFPERGTDRPPQGSMTELRAVGGAPQAQQSHVPLRPAGSGQPHQASRFPHFAVEDARPQAAPAMEQDPVRPAGEPEPFEIADPAFHTAPGAQADQWQEADRPAPEGLGERFEEEFEAPYTEIQVAEAGGPFDPGFDTAVEGSAEMADAAYAERDSGDYDLSDPHPDAFVAEGEADPQPQRRAPARSRRPYKGLLAAAGVLGVVVLGGAVAAMIGTGGPASDGAPPPVVSAEAGPAKVAPEGTEQAQAGDGAGQAVYDRVAGRAPKSDEKLIDRAEEPRQVSRVVLPEADGAADEPTDAAAAGEDAADDGPDGSADRTAAAIMQQDGAPGERISGQISSETPAMQSGPRIDPVGPRRVRTVKVRPDGTIVSTPDPVRVAEAPAQDSQQVDSGFGADAPEPLAVRTVTVNTDESPSGPLAGQAGAPAPDNAAAPQPLMPTTGSRPAEPAQAETDDGAEPAPPAQAESDDAAEPTPPAETQLAMLPRARPDEVPAAFTSRAVAPSRESRQAESRSAASSRDGEPVNLLAGPASPRPQAQPAQAAARPAAASSASPYAVQVSAQRSEDQARAAFDGLKSRFPSVLGSREAQIQRADLGDRGIYYRVRIGAQSQAEANQLCEQLKAAGGSCFVTR